MKNPIRRSAHPVTAADLALFEHRLGLSLPEEYRAFLLTHNGGVPRRNTFAHVNPKGQRRDTWLRWLYSLGREGLTELGVHDLESACQERPRGLPAGMIPVGDADFGYKGLVCLVCDGPDAGKVFFHPLADPDKVTVYPVADSWDRFLTQLRFESGKRIPPWHEAIQDGDMARLRQWLEQNTKEWKADVSFLGDIRRIAVEENQWPALQVLMEFGLGMSSPFEMALNRYRFDLALQLLRTGKVSKEHIRECLLRGRPFLWYLPPLLEELVATGADINHETDSGDTPLHAAVEARSEEGLRFLIRKGADPTVKNDDGRTPLGLARRLEEPKLAEILHQAEETWRKRPVEVGPLVVEFDRHGVEMTNVGPALTLVDIQALEQKIGLTFPPEYRALLLKANGGVPRPNVLPSPEGSGPETDEYADYISEVQLAFLPLCRGQEWMRPVGPDSFFCPTESVEGAREWSHEGEGIPRGKVPIGWLDNWRGEGAWLLLGCKGEDRGQLFAFFYRNEALDLTLPGLFEQLGQAKGPADSPLERLMAALAARDLAGVKAALRDGGKTLVKKDQGQALLDRACDLGFDAAALAMVKAGARASVLLRTAVRYGRFQLAHRLLRHRKAPSQKLLFDVLRSNPALFSEVALLRDLAQCPTFGQLVRRNPALLNQAVGSGSVDGVRVVLENGGDFLAWDETQGTLLHQAAMARHGDAAAVIRYLLSLGIKPNRPTCQGQTALHLAVIMGNLGAARALIDAGEDLHARYDRYIPGVTPKEAAERMKRMQEMLGTAGLGGFLQPSGGNDEDTPPLDTSTPLGEKLAELRDVLEQKKKQIADQLAGKVPPGYLGQGHSAAEAAAQTPEGRAILPELEAYAAQCRPPDQGGRT